MRPSLVRNERGGIAILSALLGGTGCLIAALAIDLGSIALQARQLQGAADLAAMAAAQDLSRSSIAASATVAANLPSASAATSVALGVYTADRTLAPRDRFAPGAVGANAVRVTVSQATPLYFGSIITGKPTVQITRSATASLRNQPRAMLSIGSRLTSLNGGVANQVLGALTGSTVSLTAMDYNALAGAQVNLLQYSDALAANLGVEAGDYKGLLNRTVDTGRALSVLEHLAGDSGDSALSKLSVAAAGKDLKVGDLIGVESGADDLLASGLNARVSALDLATAMIEVGGGKRQLALNLAVPAGVAELTASLAIGERPNHSPWLTVTSGGEPIIRTAQARLYLKVRTSAKLSGLAQVNVPILVELASAEARLNAATCTPDRTATVGVRPGLARASIGVIDESRLDDFTHPLTPTAATLVSVAGLVTVTGKADVEAAQTDFIPVRFSGADVDDQTIRSVKTSTLATGVIGSLFQRLQVDVKALGLGLGLGGLSQALGTLLSPLGPVLDGVLNPVFDTLGLKFGEADVIVHGLDCGAGRVRLIG